MWRVLKDVNFRITPLSASDARDMVKSIKGYRLLQGYRGHSPADVDALEELLVRTSTLVEEIPEIKELEMNPVFALEPGKGACIVDCRIRVSAQSKSQPARYTHVFRRLSPKTPIGSWGRNRVSPSNCSTYPRAQRARQQVGRFFAFPFSLRDGAACSCVTRFRRIVCLRSSGLILAGSGVALCWARRAWCGAAPAWRCGPA
jgi:hypothetical protein